MPFQNAKDLFQKIILDQIFLSAIEHVLFFEEIDQYMSMTDYRSRVWAFNGNIFIFLPLEVQ